MTTAQEFAAKLLDRVVAARAKRGQAMPTGVAPDGAKLLARIARDEAAASKAAASTPAPKPATESTASVIDRARKLVAQARRVIAEREREAGSSGLPNMSGRGAELDAIMGCAPAARTPAAPRLVGSTLQFGSPAAAPAGAIDRARLEQQAKMDRSMGVPAARCEVRRPDGRVEIGASLTPAEIELARANGCKVRQMATKVGA